METRAQVVQSANLRDLAGFWWGLEQAGEEGWQYVNGEPSTSEAIHWGKGYPTPDKESSCAYMYVHSGFEYNLYTYNAEEDDAFFPLSLHLFSAIVYTTAPSLIPFFL